MLTIYVKDLNLEALAQLQNLLDDGVSLCPLTNQLIALKCAGEIRAYLADLSVRSVEISQTDLEGLSLKEQRVLELLEYRLTNRQIGEQLEISQKTVEKHVSSILRKLQLRSRTDIWPNQ